MQPNTPQLWDKVWQHQPSAEEHRYNLALEAHTIRWQRIEKRVGAAFGGFEQLRVIEMGAGAGTNAGLMAQRGAQVTISDYSERALAQAREFFKANDLRAEFVQANALDLPAALREKFDVALSFGLAEHFSGADRVQIFRSHLDALRGGGMAFVSVPNAFNVPYRAFKWVAETTGRWKLGVEIPFTHRELQRICAQLDVTDCEFFGDSFLTSLQFVNPWRYARKRLARPRSFEIARISKEVGTPLDERWSYATVLVMRRGRANGDEVRRNTFA